MLAVFDAYADHANLAYEHGFRGCGLLNAAAELPAGDLIEPLGALAAQLLEETLVDGQLLGVAWGRTLAAAARAMPVWRRRAHVVMTSAVSQRSIIRRVSRIIDL